MEGFKIVGDVGDVISGSLDFRRRTLVVDRHGAPREVTAVSERGDVTVGVGCYAETFFAFHSTPVYEPIEERRKRRRYG